jgi:hypothetical protein
MKKSGVGIALTLLASAAVLASMPQGAPSAVIAGKELGFRWSLLQETIAAVIGEQCRRSD